MKLENNIICSTKLMPLIICKEKICRKFPSILSGDTTNVAENIFFHVGGYRENFGTISDCPPRKRTLETHFLCLWTISFSVFTNKNCNFLKTVAPFFSVSCTELGLGYSAVIPENLIKGGPVRFVNCTQFLEQSDLRTKQVVTLRYWYYSRSHVNSKNNSCTVSEYE